MRIPRSCGKNIYKKWQWAPSKTQACENEFTVMDWNFVQGESHQCSLVSLRISLESKKDHEKRSILELMSPDNFQRLCHAKSYQSNLQGKWNLQGMFCDKQTVQTCAHTHTNTAGWNTGFNIVQPAFYMLALVSAQQEGQGAYQFVANWRHPGHDMSELLEPMAVEPSRKLVHDRDCTFGIQYSLTASGW